MQLTLYQLQSHLKQTLCPCYLLHSNEWLLVDEAQNNIIDAAKQKGFSNKKTFYIQQESDWNQLASDTQNFDLFADKTVYVIRHFLSDLTPLMHQYIEKQLNSKPLLQLWILLTEKLKKTAERKPWYQAILKHGVIIPIYELKGLTLKKWIQHQLKTMSLRVSEEAVIDELITLTEGNLVATYQTIEKLSLLFPKQCLTVSQLKSAIYDNARFTVFQLVDELLKGETRKALRILDYLYQTHDSPILIVWTIANQIRTLIHLAQQLSTGVPIQRILQSQWQFRRPYFQAALSRLSLQNLQQLLLCCSTIDKMLKSLNLIEARRTLDILIMRFNHFNFLKG